MRIMLERYVRGFHSQRPVHAWAIDEPAAEAAHV